MTKILNLGCGTKTSADPSIVNIDWSILLRIKSNRLLDRLAPVVLTGARRARYEALPGNILVHNIATGIPAADDSADGAYHSHLLEHLDPHVGDGFLKEIRRVLKPGGIVRIVVPDLETLCRDYIADIDAARADPAKAPAHDATVAEILEQSVRREAAGTSTQAPLRRKVENAVLGDARKRGETHQWMYDEVNLGEKLRANGFVDVQRHDYTTSGLSGWHAIGLDLNPDGTQYKPGSLYMEARKG